jgi:hypothetical protein
MCLILPFRQTIAAPLPEGISFSEPEEDLAAWRFLG